MSILFGSSIGRKLIMALSGIFLILTDSTQTFNAAANFMPRQGRMRPDILRSNAAFPHCGMARQAVAFLLTARDRDFADRGHCMKIDGLPGVLFTKQGEAGCARAFCAAMRHSRIAAWPGKP